MTSQPPPESGAPRVGGDPPSKDEAPRHDVVIIRGVEPDGRGLSVVRLRDDSVEAGTLRPLEHGRPLRGELLRVKPRRELPLVCDVEVELEAPPAAALPESRPQRSGPAQVATPSYRENWDRIWRKDRTPPN